VHSKPSNERTVRRDATVIVDRLQLPQEYLSKLSLKDLVRLELEPDHVQVHPTAADAPPVETTPTEDRA
jgi:hypothetical protein